MNSVPRLSPEDERACNCLAPYVRQGCDSLPLPKVRTAIHAAAERKIRRSRILPFVRFAYAAAAMLVVTLSGWLLIRSSMPSEAQRQAALMDDVLFLCAGDQSASETVLDPKDEDLARRLLNLQGLDAATTPSVEVPAEPLPLPSKDSQSRNTYGLQARKCG